MTIWIRSARDRDSRSRLGTTRVSPGRRPPARAGRRPCPRACRRTRGGSPPRPGRAAGGRAAGRRCRPGRSRSAHRSARLAPVPEGRVLQGHCRSTVTPGTVEETAPAGLLDTPTLQHLLQRSPGGVAPGPGPTGDHVENRSILNVITRRGPGLGPVRVTPVPDVDHSRLPVTRKAAGPDPPAATGRSVVPAVPDLPAGPG